MIGPRALGTVSMKPRLLDPSKHICPYRSNRLEDWKPELQKTQNRCFFPDQGELSVTQLLLVPLSLLALLLRWHFRGVGHYS